MTKIEQLKQEAGLYTDTSGRWANADGVDRLIELVTRACMTEIILLYGEGREIPIEGGGHYHSHDWDEALTKALDNIEYYLGVKK
jgi:hypothetical protein